MLHMVAVTHGADACPINNPEATGKVMATFGQDERSRWQAWSFHTGRVDQYAGTCALVYH